MNEDMQKEKSDMNQALDVLLHTLPIIFLIALGTVTRHARLISPEALEDIKKIIVYISLPAMLFLTFASTTLVLSHLVIIAVMIALCSMMLLAGIRVFYRLSPDNPIFPGLFSGYEAGMMGYALFATFFGASELYAFAIVDLGQVVFVFLILTMFLHKRTGDQASLKKLAKKFFLSPVILAIIVGIFLSVTSLYQRSLDLRISDAFIRTLELAGALTQPLICIVIGYELKLKAKNMKTALFTVALRLSVMVTLAWLIATFVFIRMLNLDPIFTTALYAMLILPPPFVLPIFAQKADPKHRAQISDILSLHVIGSLLAYMVMVYIV